MAIAPISSVSFRNNASVNFGSKHENDTEGQEFQPTKRQGTTDLSKMPVVVLLALTPAMTNAKTPEVHPNVAPVVTTMEKLSENTAPTYIISPDAQEAQQSNAPYGWECLSHEHINFATKFRSGKYEYNLLFTSRNNTKEVSAIYAFPTNMKGSSISKEFPPEVRQLVYHNIGKDKEFCGIIIDTDITDPNTGKYKGTAREEIRIPDGAAQKIIDLLTDYSALQNKTSVKIKEVNSAEISPMKIYK